MGQTCAKASCYSVEQDSLEGSRADSPDPVMYDLMRKSIQATHQVRRSSVVVSGSDPNVRSHSQSSAPVYAGTTSSDSGKNSKRPPVGQYHLLYKHGSSVPSSSVSKSSPVYNYHRQQQQSRGHSSDSARKPAPSTSGDSDKKQTPSCYPTRLLTRRRSQRVMEEGGGTHIYAIRYPESSSLTVISQEQAPASTSVRGQEQCPPRKSSSRSSSATDGNSIIAISTRSGSRKSAKGTSGSYGASVTSSTKHRGGLAAATHQASSAVAASMFPPIPVKDGGDIFSPTAMGSDPVFKVLDWVTVSEEHKIFIADIGLSATECDHIVKVTEDVCRGQYAAYTYAKQTLGCREFPMLAQTCFHPVHTAVSAIGHRLKGRHLQLDDREPHIVKYDVTRRERQKLDMHTDKSEWTFLIALSNGCGVDYEGGGTYFECLDSTVHIQRGHALIFPGKLRHCGQKITSGLRFLLVGFLVDKTSNSVSTAIAGSAATVPTATVTTTTTTATVLPKTSSMGGLPGIHVPSLTSGLSLNNA